MHNNDYGLEVIDAPTVEPITKAELKLNLRLDTGTVEDSLLDVLIQVGRERAEVDTGKSLITQTLRLKLNGFPYWHSTNFGCYRYIELPKSPVQEIDSISYIDGNGDTQILDDSVYTLDTSRPTNRVLLTYNNYWPSTILSQPNSVIIEYVAGYGDSGADVPATSRQAVMLAASVEYYDREGIDSKRDENEKAYQRLINANKSLRV